MEKYTYNGEVYYYNKGRWLTASYVAAPTAVVSKLNKMLNDNTDLSGKSVEELIKIMDGARLEDSNIQLAIKAVDVALQKATVTELRGILPRATSNYRKIGQPQKAIDFANQYIDEYGRAVSSAGLYTSLASAYCDLEKIGEARKCADKAMALSAGRSSDELKSVYARIKRLDNSDT